MNETVLARYERESTLWKNANLFYHAQDWTLMECLFIDYSDIRNSGIRYINKKTGEDITEEMTRDMYAIRLTNKHRNNTKTYKFATRDEANEFYKRIMADKVLKTFKRVA